MSITQHSALVVSDKPAVENLMSIYLKQAGVGTFSIAHSLREAVQKATQELPHLILVVEDTPDATALQIVDAIRKQPTVDKALIFVLKACSQEELVRSVQLRVTSVLTKTNDGNLLIEKLKQKLALLGGLSPYAVRAENLHANSQSELRIPLKIVGKAHEHVVCRSPVMAQPGTMATIHPEDKSLAAFQATFAASPRELSPDGTFQNYFSLSGIVGQGRAWLQAKLSSEAKPPTRRLLVFERSRERIDPLRKVLEFHGIETEHVDSINSLCNVFRTRCDDFGAIYFCETLVGATALPWDKTKKELPPDKLPLEITATSAQRPVPMPRVVWLQKPFGVDQLVRAFQAALASSGKGAEAAAADKPIPCVCTTSARLVALDEAGGILLSKLQPAVNAEFIIEHPFLTDTLKMNQARVVATEPHAADPSLVMVRFALTQAASSKEKYWSSIYRSLEAMRSAAPKPAPAAAPATPAATPATAAKPAATAPATGAKPLAASPAAAGAKPATAAPAATGTTPSAPATPGAKPAPTAPGARPAPAAPGAPGAKPGAPAPAPAGTKPGTPAPAPVRNAAFEKMPTEPMPRFEPTKK